MQQRRLLPAARQTTLNIFSDANVPNPLASDGNVRHKFCPLIGQTLEGGHQKYEETALLRNSPKEPSGKGGNNDYNIGNPVV